MRKWLALFWVLLMLGGAAVEVQAAEEDFAGTRVLVYTADRSDVDNYINGGREELDLALRSSAPGWLQYQLTADGRNLVLTFQFSFRSLEDYTKKAEALLGYSPDLTYLDETYLLLFEGNHALEFLQSLEAALLERGCLAERGLSEIFPLTKNEMVLGENSYQSGDKLEVRENGDRVVPVDGLEFATRLEEDGSYTRTIVVWLNGALLEKGDATKVDQQMSTAGEVGVVEDADGSLTFTVSFTAADEEELARQTARCLNAATTIHSEYHYVGEKTMLVDRREFVDYTKLLRSGSFVSEYDFSAQVTHLISLDSRIMVSGTHMSAENAEVITCRYNMPPFFSEVEVKTDLSNLFGRMSRTITFVLPQEFASYYHDNTKTRLEKRLIRGAVLDIADEGGDRYYRISYASYFSSDLAEFTESILGTSGKMERTESWVPYGSSEIRDAFGLSTRLGGIASPKEIRAVYRLPTLAAVKASGAGNVQSQTDQEIVFLLGSEGQLQFEYRSVCVWKTMVEAAGLLAVTTVILIVKRKMKR